MQYSQLLSWLSIKNTSFYLIDIACFLSLPWKAGKSILHWKSGLQLVEMFLSVALFVSLTVISSGEIQKQDEVQER